MDAGLKGAFVFGRLHIVLALVLDGAGEEATCTTGRVHDLLVQFWIDHAHHELGDRARSVELAGVARALQIAQQLLIEIAELMAFLRLVEVHALLDLVDHLADQLAGLHVVVGIFEYAAHHVGGRGGAVFVEVLQLREQVVVDEALQLVTGDTFRVGRPGAPAAAFRNGRPIVVIEQFPLLLAVVEDLEEQHPHELADALRIAVNADVLAHDVLDGFDGAADGHAYFLNKYSRCQAR
ncbi:hypothetical protein D9M69_428630 [compost metagenome]